MLASARPASTWRLSASTIRPLITAEPTARSAFRSNVFAFYPIVFNTNGCRAAVCQAARRLFAAHGYARVTMREVASEAGVAVQTVHVIFGTKLSLAQGIVELAL